MLGATEQSCRKPEPALGRGALLAEVVGLLHKLSDRLDRLAQEVQPLLDPRKTFGQSLYPGLRGPGNRSTKREQPRQSRQNEEQRGQPPRAAKAAEHAH